MRMGQAFSRALDPSRPPLFEGMGSLDPLPEEAWHASCLPGAPKLARAAPRDERTAAERASGRQQLEGSGEGEEEGEEEGLDELEQYDQEESGSEGTTLCLRGARSGSLSCGMLHLVRRSDSGHVSGAGPLYGCAATLRALHQ